MARKLTSKTNQFMPKEQKKIAENARTRKGREKLNPPPGYTEEQYTGNKSGKTVEGIIRALIMEYDPVDTYHISKRSLKAVRDINETLGKLRNHSCAVDIILQSSPGKSRNVYYLLNPMYRNIDPIIIVYMITGSYNENYIYASNIKQNGPNKSEAKIFDFIRKNNRYDWEFTGTRWLQNRVGRRYPDFIDKKRGLIIEFFGPKHNCIFRQDKNDHDTDEIHEERRIMEYNKLGYECLVIWYTISDEEAEKRISEFIEKFKDRIMPTMEQLASEVKSKLKTNRMVI